MEFYFGDKDVGLKLKDHDSQLDELRLKVNSLAGLEDDSNLPYSQDTSLIDNN
jgi:hypothetical protein